MPFAEIAKEIIKQSFRNAVFIDDKMVEPYQYNVTHTNYEFCKNMFDDFRNNHCSLDIYNYKNFEEWGTVKDYHLKRKDLLILDWELKEHDNTYIDSLRILEYAVNTESLHFICIYTNIIEGDISEKIVYKINSYFSNFDIIAYKQLLKKIEKKFDELGVDFREIKNSIKTKLKELDLESNKRERVKQIIREVEDIIYTPERTIENFFRDEVFKDSNANHKETLISIGYLLNDCNISSNNNKVPIIHLSQNSLLINDTVIKIFNKQRINPVDLHSHFSSALLEGTHNFMTIVGLEIRNLLMESSAFIGKEIDSIDEEAFFYHESRQKPREAFFEFLKLIWKEQSSSFLLRKEPKTFTLLDEYKRKNNITEKLATIDWAKGENQKNLAKLNYHYNILLTKRRENDFVRFGDVFELYKKGADYDFHSENIYLLNITAHCDCVYPQNIHYNYFFVRGSTHDLQKSLEDEDAGFNSYIIRDNEPRVIEWITKPFNVYILEKNNISIRIPIEYFKESRFLEYICTIKENYTQRIANEAFAHASRVGIYFTGLKKT